MSYWTSFFMNEKGATAIEYAMIAGIISIAIVVAVNSLGLTLSGIFQSVADGF